MLQSKARKILKILETFIHAFASPGLKLKKWVERRKQQSKFYGTLRKYMAGTTIKQLRKIQKRLERDLPGP